MLLFRQVMLATLVFVWCISFIATTWSSQFGRESSDAKSATASNPLELNLRILWGGARLADYSGSIELDSGRLVCLQQLGIDPFDAGFGIHQSDQKLSIDDKETRFGGSDIRVQGKANSRLNVSIRTVDPQSSQATTKKFTWLLSDLRDIAHVENIDVGDCKFSIDRVPGDRLRVTTARSHLIYSSEEPLSIQIQPCSLQWNSTPGILEYAVVQLDGGREVVRQSRSIAIDEFGNAESWSISQSAPHDEGVYELRSKVEPKRMLPGLLIKAPVVERSVQFVVYNNTPSLQHGQDRYQWLPLKEVASHSFEIKSQTERLLEHFDGSIRFPFLEAAKSLTMGRKEPHPVSLHSQLSLSPGNQGTISLAGLIPGEMHRLSVSTPSLDPSLRVHLTGIPSQREKKKSNQVYANEVLEVSTLRSIHRVLESSKTRREERIEVLFWPSSRTAQLELSNLSSTSSIEVSSVNLDFWSMVNDRKPTSVHSTQGNSTLEFHSSNVRALFTSNSKSSRPKGTYDDWGIFLEFSIAAAKYCQACGFRTFAMIVDDEGSTLFPSTKGSANCRYDTGIFSADGRDPIRKDIVELMYRAMARHGIEFVPMLEMNGLMRDVEGSLLRSKGDEVLQQRDGSNSVAPSQRKYNPLSISVQHAISSGMEELELRYREHPNFRGIALCVSDQSHLCVSSRINETNRAILDRFVSDLSLKIPMESDQRDRFIEQNANTLYQQWLQNSMIAFLKQMKTQPKWISMPCDGQAYVSDNELPCIYPFQIGLQGLNLSEIKASILNQWNTESPHPVHLAIHEPVQRVESSVAKLIEMSAPFQSTNLRSLVHRDGARTVSRVHVWSSDDKGTSLLLTNAGAIAETVAIAWDSMPEHYQISSTYAALNSSPNEWIEFVSTSNEWRILIPAGEAIRVDLNDHCRPLYWFSYDAMMVRGLQSVLQLVENAINRLSIPQASFGIPNNGGFEGQSLTGRRGRVEGWTTSLDPNAVVGLDSISASEGRSSIKIDSKQSSSIAWLQSDPFALTITDRLSVSFKVASSRLPAQATVSVWRFDPTEERFEPFASQEFSSKFEASSASVVWNSVRFDFTEEFENGSDRFETHLYRLQFEVKGQGQLRLDDVVIATDFLRDEERRDLRSELFLARSSMQNGDLGPAVGMLTSPRGRLVLWGDNSAKDRNYLIATPSVKSPSQTPKESVRPTEMPGAKSRPTKRIRNPWWPTRNKE